MDNSITCEFYWPDSKYQSSRSVGTKSCDLVVSCVHDTFLHQKYACCSQVDGWGARRRTCEHHGLPSLQKHQIRRL